MSDLLLVGQSPSEDVGKEFFLHCMDWWLEILQAIEACVGDAYPFEALFYRDLFLAPMTPHLSGPEAWRLGNILKDCGESGALRQALESAVSAYRDDEEPDALEEIVDDRMAQLDAFIDFLGACGGCRAKWHGVDD